MVHLAVLSWKETQAKRGNSNQRSFEFLAQLLLTNPPRKTTLFFCSSRCWAQFGASTKQWTFSKYNNTILEHRQRTEPMVSIKDLDDASLVSIFDFLPGHFRFVASVNRRFRFLYRSTPNTFYTAAMKSDATRDKWLEEERANVRRNGCALAAKYGNLEALQWLRSHDCRWDSDVCTEAAAGGHLHILHWARSQSPPCPWNEWVCTMAAMNGQLDVLQWLRSQIPPCPWNRVACAWAVVNGHLEVLQWLRSQTPPCPWNLEHCLRLARERSCEMEVFIRSHRV